PVTTIKPFDPLIHSSLSTGSTRHSGDGGWGIANGKYGEFTCGVCHTPSTTNIKRIRTTLPSAPDTSKGDFPGAGGAILFLDATEPTTDFGDDSDAPRASSNRICEVCHTYDATQTAGVNKHAFDQQVNSSHENAKDCISCHKHNAGFSAAGGSCDSCHGYPPDPADGYSYQAVEGKGAHVKHVNHLATLAGITLDPNNDSFGDANVTIVCGVCHDMGAATHQLSGGDRLINFNGSTTFQFGASAPAYNGVEDVGSATTPKTCSNINCHFQESPWWE
ncbi:MAG: cytochrome c3 family protein, partial [Phycisphaeraceae bacterium]|nr:cytochrome c3 family protein [Phycisphaeraceae bacterium]